MAAVKNPKARRLFQTRRLVATPAVLEEVPRPELLAAYERHVRGDWGEACAADWRANNDAIRNGAFALRLQEQGRRGILDHYRSGPVRYDHPAPLGLLRTAR